MSRLSAAAALVPALAGSCHPGLQSLAPADRARISAAQPRSTTHSVALDRALQSSQPSGPRWDYGVGKRSRSHSEELIWIEVHPASGGCGLHQVEAKAHWLLGWLSGVGTPLNYKPRRFVWVASGRSAFARTDPKLRALNALGVQFAGGHLVL